MNKRTALLIDGSNLFAASKQLNFHIDYKRLLDKFNLEFDVVRAHYYTAIRDLDRMNEDDPSWTVAVQIVKLTDWLTFNGYTVVTKIAKEYNEGGIIKGNMDVEITVDALLMSDRIDHFILGTGDGDFRYLVDALHRKGLEVSAISTIRTNPPMIASSLRREVDVFYDLFDMRKHVERER